jgi:hypothetical protein
VARPPLAMKRFSPVRYRPPTITIDQIDRVPFSNLQRQRRGLGDYYGEDYGGGSYEFPDPPVDDPPWLGNLTDNGDGSYTDERGDIYDAAGIWLGFENDDGTWTDPQGNVWNAQNEPAFDPSFEQDPTTGLYFDNLTGSWYAIDPQGNPALVSENPDGPSFEELSAAQGIVNGSQFVQPPGLLEGIGNFLGKLFGGGGGAQGGGNFGGGGGSMSSGQKQQADQRAQQAQQQLAQAQSQGANAATIQNLQRQLALAQAAAARASGMDWSKTILVAVAAGAVTYAIATRRPPSPPAP